MRKAKIFVQNSFAGVLEEIIKGETYRFIYDNNYQGDPISLTMPLSNKIYEFNQFPPFFDGVLPEGIQLEGLLRQRKIDKNDLFSQLIAVGKDLVGAVTIEELK